MMRKYKIEREIVFENEALLNEGKIHNNVQTTPSDQERAYHALKILERGDPHAVLTPTTCYFDDPPQKKRKELMKEWARSIHGVTGVRIQNILEKKVEG